MKICIVLSAEIKIVLLKLVSLEEGKPAPKLRSFRRSDHHGIQANNKLPKIFTRSQTSHI